MDKTSDPPVDDGHIFTFPSSTISFSPFRESNRNLSDKTSDPPVDDGRRNQINVSLFIKTLLPKLYELDLYQLLYPLRPFFMASLFFISIFQTFWQITELLLQIFTIFLFDYIPVWPKVLSGKAPQIFKKAKTNA